MTTWLKLLGRQVRYENLVFWRNPAAAFFTFVFPLLFLVIFNGLFGHNAFFVPAIAAFSVVTACYTNIAMGVTISRDEGVLKRVRGTPLPTSVYIGGRLVHAVAIALLLVAIVTVAGAVFYDVPWPTETPGRFVITLVLGAATFCALGLAITSAIPNAEAAPAVVNASVLPLLFISNVFYPASQLPDWLKTIADLGPIKHFADAMLASFGSRPGAWELVDLVALAAWGVAGVVLTSRFFSWEPRR